MGRLAGAGAGVIVSTHDLAEAERCSQIAFLADGRVVAMGTPDEVARNTPAAAFELAGGEARFLAAHIDAVPGVIASYPQGSSLRIVAAVEAKDRLHRVANAHHTTLA